MRSISSKWGGNFSIEFQDDYRTVLRSSSNYKKVYLTRYGTPMQNVLYTMKTYRNLLLIVTDTEAVTSMFSNADFCISITDQPHSTSAAIAVFLHAFFSGRELAMHFENARYKVIPSERGVHVEKTARD